MSYIRRTRSLRTLVIVAAIVAHLSLPAEHVRFVHAAKPSYAFGLNELLAYAKRRALLGDWDGAAPLFKDAAQRSGKANRREFLYAQAGFLRATIESRPYEETSLRLAIMLRDPEVEHDSALRLWCLTAKGYADLNVDIHLARRTWTEVKTSASKLNDSIWTARATGELAIIEFLEGDRSHAVWHIGQALYATEKNRDRDGYVRYLSMLGDGFVEEKRYWIASQLLEHAIEVSNGTPGAGFPFLAYQGAAAALLGTGEYDRARKLLLTSLRFAQENHRNGQEGLTYLLLGNYSNRTGDRDAAAQNWSQAIAILKAIKAYRPLAQAYFNLATLQREQGELDAAEQSLRQGVVASRRTRDRIYYSRDLTALAQIAVLRGNLNKADKEYTKAENVFESLAFAMNSSFGAHGFAAARSKTYLEHFRLQLQLGQAEKAFQTIERVRALSAIERQQKLRVNLDSAKLAQPEREVSALQLALLHSSNSQERSRLLDQLAEGERTLAFTENEMDLHPPRPELHTLVAPQIQRVLRPKEFLLEYVVDEKNSWCFVLSRHSISLVDLNTTSRQLDPMVEQLLQEIKEQRVPASEAKQLYQALIKPLALSQDARVIIVPDGSLHRIPFEVLQQETGEPLLFQFTVSYATSATELWLLRHATPEMLNRKPLLAVGGVNYAGLRVADGRAEVHPKTSWFSRGISELTGASFPDLAHSRDEVVAVAEAAGPNSTILTGDQATESAFKKQPLDAFQVLHFAVHSISDSQVPERSALVLGTAPGEPDDGLLQAREIMDLHLTADLVTLSGCDTVVGTVRDQAGVESLQDAFIMAGAHSVVGSLWQVQDQPTALLMEFFYRHLGAGEDKATALSNAKKDFLAKTKDPAPFLWAGFILVGDGAGSVRW